MRLIGVVVLCGLVAGMSGCSSSGGGGSSAGDSAPPSSSDVKDSFSGKVNAGSTNSSVVKSSFSSSANVDAMSSEAKGSSSSGAASDSTNVVVMIPSDMLMKVTYTTVSVESTGRIGDITAKQWCEEPSDGDRVGQAFSSEERWVVSEERGVIDVSGVEDDGEEWSDQYDYDPKTKTLAFEETYEADHNSDAGNGSTFLSGDLEIDDINSSSDTLLVSATYDVLESMATGKAVFLGAFEYREVLNSISGESISCVVVETIVFEGEPWGE